MVYGTKPSSYSLYIHVHVMLHVCILALGACMPRVTDISDLILHVAPVS